MTFRYMLAPLEDTSDSALRTLCSRHGADLAFTEMTRIDSLARKNKSTWQKIEIHGSPAAIQLVGAGEQKLKKFLHFFKPNPLFRGFNLNLGCPSSNLVNQGIGCAMVKRIAKTRKIVSIIKNRGYSCSIKIRLGLNQYEKKSKVYLNLIDAVDADFFIVHARHANQHYDEPADTSIYPDCVATGKEIIANGDIHTKEQIASLQEMGVQGAMIGRYAVQDPAIFNTLKGIEAPSLEELRNEYLALTKEFPSVPKYSKNVLKRLGVDDSLQMGKSVYGWSTVSSLKKITFFGSDNVSDFIRSSTLFLTLPFEKKFDELYSTIVENNKPKEKVQIVKV